MSRPQDDPYALKIYIDGSAVQNNPGDKCGFAGIIEFPESHNKENEQVFQEGYTDSTNNRMELRACLRAMEYAKANAAEFRIMGVYRVIIVTDSKYVHDHQNLATAWRKAGWKSVDGRPIENVDLWKRFISIRSTVNVEIVWEAGKKTLITKQIDSAAKQAARILPVKPDMGYKKGKMAKSFAGKIPILSYPANGQSEIIRIFRYRPQGRSNDLEVKVDFDLYNPSTRNFDKKYSAYIKDQSLIHRHKYYKVKFNTNIKYPIIEEIEEIIDFNI